MKFKLTFVLSFIVLTNSALANDWGQGFRSIMFQTLNNHGFNIQEKDMSCISIINLSCIEKGNPDGYRVIAYDKPLRVTVYRGFPSSKMLACFVVINKYLTKSQNINECDS